MKFRITIIIWWLEMRNRIMAVFMARGYKDNPFHRHVARSIANYFSDQKRDQLRAAIQKSDYENEELLSLLESETVTAWGSQSEKRSYRNLFE